MLSRERAGKTEEAKQRRSEFGNADGEPHFISCRLVDTPVDIVSQTLIPTLATVLTFVTYSLTGHELNVATIFASMQLFSIIQLPVSQLPMVMTALSDSHVAIVRISKILASEEQPHDLIIDASSPFAVEAHGDFCYETATPPDQLESEARPEKANATVVSHDTKTSEESSSKESTGTEANSHNGPTEKQREPFQLKDIDLQIPRGSCGCLRKNWIWQKRSLGGTAGGDAADSWACGLWWLCRLGYTDSVDTKHQPERQYPLRKCNRSTEVGRSNQSMCAGQGPGAAIRRR
jgi:ABC-type multidrug transport system fused ATPase/permease subunit